MSFAGMLVGCFGMLRRRRVVALLVMLGRRVMRLCGVLVVFGGLFVCIFRHGKTPHLNLIAEEFTQRPVVPPGMYGTIPTKI